MDITIHIDLDSLQVTVNVTGADTIATEAPEAQGVEDLEQKTLADFHLEHYDLAAAADDLNAVRNRAAEARRGAENRNPHHCQRCNRAHRQRSPLRGWRCRSCEHEEDWGE